MAMSTFIAAGHNLVKPVNQPDVNSPEGFVNQQAGLLRRQLQDEFQSEWESLAGRLRNAGTGSAKTKYYLDELHSKYRSRAHKLDQEIERQLAGLGQTAQLGQQGLISNAPQAQWRQVLGPEQEAAMFPKQSAPTTTERRGQIIDQLEKSGIASPEQIAQARAQNRLGTTIANTLDLGPQDEQDPLKEFGKLDIYRNRIESRLKDFRVRPGKVTGRIFPKYNPEEIEVYDPSLLGKDEKGEYTGGWRKATPDEIEEHRALSTEQNRVTAMQRPLMSSMMRSAISSPRAAGSIAQQVHTYLQRDNRQPENNDPLGLR